MVEKTAFARFASDDDFIRTELARIADEARQAGKSLAEAIAQTARKGAQTIPYSNLTPHTEYVACAFGVSAEGTAASGLFKKTVATAEEVRLEQIDIDIAQLSKNTVSIDFTPSTDLLTYYATIIDKAYFEELGSDEANIKDDLAYFELLAEKEGSTVPAIIAKYTHTGKQRLPFERLTPATEYVAYAFGVNTDGTVTSGLFKEPFATPAPAQSDNRITLNVSKIGIDGALITASTTNDDPYILDVWEASKLEGMTDEQIIATVIASYEGYDIDQIASRGDDTLDATGQIAPTEQGTDCIALAFGYEYGTVTSALVKAPFRTKPGDWVETTFDIHQDALNSRKATYTVSARDAAGKPDETTPFFFTMISMEKLAQIGDTDEVLGQHLTQTIADEARAMGYPLETYIKLILFRNKKTETYTELKPGSEFIIVAAGVNTLAKVITQVARSEKATVPAPSAATVTFGTPVIEDSQVTVSVQPGAGTPVWRAAGMGSSSTYMSDDALIAHLLSDFVGSNKEEVSYTADPSYESDVYFYAVGIDASGNPGNLVKLVVPLPN